jgi:hypothetical protein
MNELSPVSTTNTHAADESHFALPVLFSNNKSVLPEVVANNASVSVSFGSHDQ